MSAATSDAETSFETKMKPLCVSERESPWALEARQCRDARVANGQSTESVAGLAPHRQASDATVINRNADPSTVRELMDDRVRNIFNGPLDQDLIIRRSLGLSLFQRPFDDLDFPAARFACERCIALHRRDQEAHGGEHRGRIARPCADHERALTG